MKFEKNIHHFQPGGSKKWTGLLQSILLKKLKTTIQNLGREQQSLWIKGVWASDTTLTLTGT